MKKITVILAVCSAIYLNGFSQTIVDLGWNWTGTEAVAPASGVYIEGLTHNSSNSSFLVYPGTANELSITCTGSDVLYKYWAGDLYAAGQTYGCLQIARLLTTNYIEVSLTANSTSKKITTAQLNGTSSSTTVGTTFIVLFSDRTPFNAERIIGYNDTCSFPFSRAGSTSITLNVPDGSKSFRICRKALIEQTSINPVLYSMDDFGETILTATGENLRIGYISTTLSDSVTTDINLTKKTSSKLNFYSNDGVLTISAMVEQFVSIHSVDGRLVKRLKLSAGVNTVSDLSIGMYIINKQKVVVK